MKNEKKVYLQSPWKTLDSTYYKFLLGSPPRGIKYYSSKKSGVLHNAGQLQINDFLKQSIKKIIKYFYPSMPNAHYTSNAKKYDLIHCAHCLSMNKKPWVCDIEFVGQFWAGSSFKNNPSKKTVRKYLQSNYCKKIMAWSEWSEKGILREFPELEGKIEIVYPAVPFVKCMKKKPTKKLQILFVGRDFEVKGGEIVWEVMDRLTKKYENIEGVIISNVLKKNFKENKKIRIYNLVSQKELFEKIYPRADIFLYPTFSDTFGFAILEAQSFGLPVVAMKTGSTHTIEETIQEGKTGFIINNSGANAHKRVFKGKVFNEIMLKTEKLVKNGRLRKEMSRNCFKEIENGKFSIKERNKKLERIYSEALE